MSRHNHSQIFFQSAAGIDRVDTANGIIHGVAVITSGVQARGHDLHVDGTTLDQMLDCARGMGKVPVKFNHGSGVENIGGWLQNFRIKDNKLLGDWVLLKSHEQYHTTLEKAREMPECFGMSAAFMGKETEKGGRKFARCSELMAVDCVVQPAANAGLFEARVDSPDQRIMANDNISPSPEPTLADVMAQLGQLNSTLTEVSQRIEAVESFQNEAQEAGLRQLIQNDPELRAQLEGLSDAELAEHGITRDFIAECVAEATEGVDAGTGVSPEGQSGAATASVEGAAGAGAGAGAAAPAMAALSAQVKQLVQLEAKRAANEKRVLLEAEQAEYDNAMTSLQAKIVEVTEFSKALVAENARLKASPRLGASTERHIDFSANPEGKHEFEVICAKAIKDGHAKTPGEAMTFAAKRNPDLHTMWLESQRR